MNDSTCPTDLGVVRAISLPPDGLIPNPDGTSGRAEYEGYFRLDRADVNIIEWLKTCVEVQREVLRDLESTSLSADQRCDLLVGSLTVLHNTLDRCLGQTEALA